MQPTTIFALASGRGAAGVAVVRLSGPAARATLAALTPGQASPPPRKLVRRQFWGCLAPGEPAVLIDEGLAVLFAAPASFTGEDVVELHVHGAPTVLTALLQILEQMPGLVLAEPGAFTRRAFDNGKLDLTAVEGLADLIAAQTEAQRRQAIRQLRGAVAAVYDDWRTRLLGILAAVEGDIEFGEEEGDVPAGLAQRALEQLETLRAEMVARLDDNRRGERLRSGLSVVVLGAPNVGKSSLINVLAKREVAIVAASAGTTRDVIDVHLDLGGVPVCLVDTAGLRDSADPVEQEGIRRARQRACEADLVLAISDGTSPWPDTGEIPRLQVLSKSDLGLALPADGTVLAVSAHSGAGIDALLARLEAWAAEAAGAAGEPLVTRARHRAALGLAVEHLARAAGQGDVVLAAEDLRLATRALGRITGRVDVDDMLDVLFATFCIGK